jgi:hypothetical protein
MNDRDELAELIRSKRKPWVTNTEHWQMEDEQADAVLAAGYRKPRTITTVAELAALSPGTRFLAHGIFYTRVGPSISARSEFGEEFRLSEFEYSGFTATVIHEPQP